MKRLRKKAELIKQITELREAQIAFKQWKKVQEGEKYRHKEVQEIRDKTIFQNEFQEELNEFEEHVYRVKHQYEELRKLRENLPVGDVVVWMDYAENYVCSYLKSGHGKGPCDGLGASVKRSADNAIKHGKTNIQNASDFFEYAKKNMEEGSQVKYINYTQRDYDEAKSYLDSKQPIQSVQGTFKVHYVVPVKENTIYTRNLSCYCQQCMDDVSQTECEGYTSHSLTVGEKKKRKDPSESNHQNQNNIEEDVRDVLECQSDTANDEITSKVINLNVKENDWIAALYLGNWFIGQVIEIDCEDNEFFVDFLEKIGKIPNRFRRPQQEDRIWIEPVNVLYILSEPPAKIGIRERSMKILNSDFDNIEKIFSKKTKYSDSVHNCLV